MMQFWISVLENTASMAAENTIIRADDENILNPPVFQAVKYRCLIFGAFIFADPHAKSILPAVQINADGDIDCLLHDLPLAAEMEWTASRNTTACTLSNGRCCHSFAMGRIWPVNSRSYLRCHCRRYPEYGRSCLWRTWTESSLRCPD